MQEMKIELHYQFLKAKIPATKHKQHFELHENLGLGMVVTW